jgi:hypothetical protein
MLKRILLRIVYMVLVCIVGSVMAWFTGKDPAGSAALGLAGVLFFDSRYCR